MGKDCHRADQTGHARGNPADDRLPDLRCMADIFLPQEKGALAVHLLGELPPLDSCRGSGPQHTVSLRLLPHDVVQRQNRHNEAQRRKDHLVPVSPDRMRKRHRANNKHHQKTTCLPVQRNILCLFRTSNDPAFYGRNPPLASRAVRGNKSVIPDKNKPPPRLHGGCVCHSRHSSNRRSLRAPNCPN